MGEDRVDSAAKPRYPNLERPRRRIRIRQNKVNVVRGNAPSGASMGPRVGSPESLEPIRSGHHRVWAAQAVRRVGTGWWAGSVLGGRRK